MGATSEFQSMLNTLLKFNLQRTVTRVWKVDPLQTYEALD